VPGGMAIEVVVEHVTAEARGAVERSLAEHGIPLCELHLVTDRSRLRRPLPLRCDLRETSFSQPMSEPSNTTHTPRQLEVAIENTPCC